MAEPEADELALLRRKVARERAARQQAEALLEAKSRELYDNNVELARLAERLEEEVRSRTSELARARDEALAANRAKSAFIANMSHEIRTPLTAIIGFSEMLRDGGLTPRQTAEGLDTITRSGRHLAAMVDNILDLSKLDSSALELERLPTSPIEVLRDVERIVGPAARARGLGFEVELAPGLPSSIETDPTRFRQILINLGQNAVKFTAAGGVILRARVVPAQELLIVDVVDTGIGLTAEAIERLFRPFGQVDASISRRYGGTGLGLYISRQLAEALGGGIEVASEPGRGSTFSVAIATGPLGTEDAGTSPAASPGEVVVPRLAGRVLVAEDTPIIQRLVAAYAEATGAEVTVVDDGAPALEAALADPFDLVVLDMQMPGMDGPTAVSLMRAAGYEGAVVGLTANVLREDIEAFLAAGCDACLSKPIDRAAFYETLSRHLPGPTAERPAAAPSPALEALGDAFRSELPDMLARAAAAAADGDWVAVGRVAHAVKGAAASFGEPVVGERAARVERAVRANDPAEAAAALAALLAAKEALHGG